MLGFLIIVLDGRYDYRDVSNSKWVRVCLFLPLVQCGSLFSSMFIACAYNAVLFFPNLLLNKSERRRRTDYCISESYLPFKVNLSYQTFKIGSQWFQRQTTDFSVEKVCLSLLKNKSMNLSTRKSEVT